MSTVNTILTAAGYDTNLYQGIVVTNVSKSSGQYWLIGYYIDPNSPELGYAYNEELTLTSITNNNGYFLSKNTKLLLVGNIQNSIDNLFGFTDYDFALEQQAGRSYIIPFNEQSSLSFFAITNSQAEQNNISIENPSYPSIGANIIVFSKGIIQSTGQVIEQVLKPIYQYTPEQIKTIANYTKASKKIILKVNETITQDILRDISNNPVLPQFKSFKDYMAYKNSLTYRNFLKNKY